MAKDREKIEDKANEPVANCDQLPMAADIQPMIRVIRGQQVIIDRDLALLYGVETRALNQAVKRNIERFPDDFMFQLDKEDVEILKSQNVTSSWGGDRRLPYAFTLEITDCGGSEHPHHESLCVHAPFHRYQCPTVPTA